MSPSNANGAFGAWQVNLGASGFTNAGSGHVANLLAFTSQQSNANYLYRVSVPGHPELNAMQTDLSMQ
ncbi:shufflon system plasmid conjugative transfer pilus tip adhesin PilV, partial [Klebsiella aerogenes]